jgi:UDP-N-acetylglucosamine transferase subunit ALG13
MNRLIKLMDGLVAGGKLNMPVAAQIGQSDYEPKNFEFHRFLDKPEFDRFIAEAGLIITQGGVGAVMTALNYKKPVIIVPRLAKYGEHVDDHQREIALAFAKKGFVLCCDDGGNIEELINECKSRPFSEYVSGTDNIARIINNYLDGA